MREPNEADDAAVARARAADAAPLRSVAALPGPRGWPLIGNLLQFDLPRLHRQFEDWADRHGPTYRLRLGRREVLVISDAETIAALLRDRPDTWRRMRPIEAVIREAGGHGVFSAEGDDWRRQRRLVMSAFDPGHLKRFYPSLQRVTERLMASWREAARRGEAIDLQASLMRYTVDVTTGLAFGVDLNTIDAPHPLQEHLDKLFPMLFRRVNLPFPYWHYLRLPIDREYDRHLRRVHEAVRGFVQAARQRLQDEPARRERPTDLLEAMLAARDADGSALTEEEVAGNVMTVLLAGEDTTANTLGWAIWLLHEHPDDWQALVAEVDAALGDARLPPSFDAARGLASIEASVGEAMRLKPVAPLLFMEANRETALAGFRLPPGAVVFCLMRRAALDARLAEDVADFRPGRWQDGADRAVQKASMPFGAGPRLCPGRYLALLEMKMVLGMLARNFELLEVGPEGGGAPGERMAFTMFPVGLKMRLAERARR
ncbi:MULTISPECIES: cytochrome P450 [unclassified Methylibium]|uniref:cytochrome P450 n=1 Tax=unclassified Methylibium TaxID=2633235 RepID=UPI0003F4744B|nr:MULTISPECIES: cytochrome P450 [unclassified Methylibium]EWS53861.1 Epi-isozizaene 5-monooxygenase/(E)-beta-farnesene synthase [Methylibium sp. T29]EWS58168.1 Epi-isozizaene 5-monooxygenase/(E)-beta-farnesene synthase [Methylibium sp. T29-B]